MSIVMCKKKDIYIYICIHILYYFHDAPYVHINFRVYEFRNTQT